MTHPPTVLAATHLSVVPPDDDDERYAPTEMTAVEDADGLNIDGLHITTSGLLLPEDLDYDAWQKIGDQLKRVERRIQWLIGDWWNYGERKWGERASQAVDGRDHETVSNYAYVARHFEPSRRRDDLTFSHHQEVVSKDLSTDEADKLLDVASERGLTRNQMRVLVRQYKWEAGHATVQPRPGSVVESDQEALANAIYIHAIDEPRIVDVTHRHGEMWVGVGHKPHRMDVDAELQRTGFTDVTADFRDMPFDDDSWDMIVFDPPHVTDAGDGLVGEGSYDERYATSMPELHGQSNIAFLFPPFLREAHRVLSDDGIVVAKMANVVHDSEYQDQAFMFKHAARELGFRVCDEMVKPAQQRGGMNDPSWRHVQHVRGEHCYWIVLRKGRVCHKQTSK